MHLELGFHVNLKGKLPQPQMHPSLQFEPTLVVHLA
jgi:hypothetical protein